MYDVKYHGYTLARPQCCRSIERLLSHNLTSNSNGHEHLIFFDLQESSITEAVERQLNATTTIPTLNPVGPNSTPQMTKKNMILNTGGGSTGRGSNSHNCGSLTPIASVGGGILHHDQHSNTPISGTATFLIV